MADLQFQTMLIAGKQQSGDAVRAIFALAVIIVNQ